MPHALLSAYQQSKERIPFAPLGKYPTPVERLSGLEDALRSSENRDITLKVLPNASHIITVPGDPSEFAEGYPRIMTDWLRDRFEVPGKR